MVIYVTENNEHRVSKKNPLKIKKSRRYIINVGSVGQPRDLNPKASFSIYDNKTNVYENFRVGYAVAETQRKIRETQLPEFLAERLAVGQ